MGTTWNKNGVDENDTKTEKKNNNSNNNNGSVSAVNRVNGTNINCPTPWDQCHTEARSRETTPEKLHTTIIKAVYDYRPRYEDDLALRKGDKMAIINKSADVNWWLVRKIENDEEGYIPSNYVISIEEQEWWFESDRRDAEKQLLSSGNLPGTFLIREDQTNLSSGAFLSILVKNDDDEEEEEEQQLSVTHYRIRKTKNGSCYITSKKTFVDIFDLIDYYSDQSSGLVCRLTRLCPKKSPPVPFKQTEIKRRDIVFGQLLGNGYYGDVCAGKLNKSLDVAVKILKFGDLTVIEFEKEAETVLRFRHPNLVDLIGICTQHQPFFIVMEHMINGSLLNFLRLDGGKNIKFSTIIDMATQIADGMSYLETKSCVHRDLRTANILVGENFVVKIADFCLCRIMTGIFKEEDNYNIYSPVKWTAPEAMKYKKFSTRSDVWSFGILLYELVTYGGDPYPDMDNKTIKTEVVKGYRMSKPRGENVVCPDELYDIMCNCWNGKPQKRPTFRLLHDLFVDFLVF